MNNKIPSIFLSYSSNDNECAEKIYNFFFERGIRLIKYTCDLTVKDNLFLFMDKILSSDYIVMIISDSFLKSKYCLYEIVKITERNNYSKTLLPLVTVSLEKDCIDNYIKHWQKERQKLSCSSEEIKNSESYKRDLEIINKGISILPSFINEITQDKYLETYNEKSLGDFLVKINFMPSTHFEYLNSILNAETFFQREQAFIDYLKIERGAENGYYYFFKARSFEKDSQFENAAFYYAKAIEQNENLDSAYIALFNLVLKGFSVRDTPLDDNKIMKFINSFRKIHEDEAIVYIVEGLIEFKKENYKCAQEKFEKALELEPTNPIASNNLGNVYEKIGLPNEAMLYFKKSIESDPNYYQAYNNLGILLCNCGKKEKAIPLFEKCLSIKPDYIYCINTLAIAYEDTKLEKSIFLYFLASSLKTKNNEAYCNLGLVFEEYLKNKEVAKILYEIALQISPQSIPNNFNYGNYLRRYTSQYNDSLRFLLKARKQKNNSCLIDYSIGLTCYKNNKKKAAYKIFKKIISEKNDFAPAYYSKAIYELNDLGDVNSSKETLLTAKKSCKPYAPIDNLLGIVYMKENDFHQGKCMFESALKIDPNFSSAHINLEGTSEIEFGEDYVDLSFCRISNERVSKKYDLSLKNLKFIDSLM